MLKNTIFFILFLFVISLQFTSVSADSEEEKKEKSDEKDEDKDKDKDEDKCKKKLKIEEEEGLKFGQLIVQSSGTARIDTNDVLSVTGGVYDFGAETQAARFKIKGCSNSHYSIQLPISIMMYSGVNSILLNSFDSYPSVNGVLNSSGKQELVVGGTIHLSGNQPAGYYSGQFEIDVYFD